VLFKFRIYTSENFEFLHKFGVLFGYQYPSRGVDLILMVIT